MDYKHDEKTYKIIGACMSVHRELGCGFFEAVYKEALEIEFQLSGIQYQPEQKLDIIYKEYLLNKNYIADFICYESIIIEIKAVECLGPVHMAQVLNYLKATGFKIGLLFNFGSQSLKFQRIAL